MTRYYSILRPISIGTYPSNHKVLNIVNFDERIPIDNINRFAWGYIEFDEPITDSEADQYDLVKEMDDVFRTRIAL